MYKSSLSGTTAKVGSDIPPEYRVTIYREKDNEYPAVEIMGYLPDTVSHSIRANYNAPFVNMLPSGGSAGLAIYRATGGVFHNRLITTQYWESTEPMSFDLTIDLIAESSVEREVRSVIRDLYSLVTPREDVNGGFFSSPGAYLDAAKLADLIAQGATAVAQAVTNAGSAIAGAVSSPVQTTKELSSATSSATGKAVDTAKGATPSSAVTGTYGAAHEANKAVNSTVASLSNKIEACLRNRISLSIGTSMYFPLVAILGVNVEDHVLPDDTGGFIYSRVTVSVQTLQVPTDKTLAIMIPKLGA